MGWRGCGDCLPVCTICDSRPRVRISLHLLFFTTASQLFILYSGAALHCFTLPANLLPVCLPSPLSLCLLEGLFNISFHNTLPHPRHTHTHPFLITHFALHFLPSVWLGKDSVCLTVAAFSLLRVLKVLFRSSLELSEVHTSDRTSCLMQEGTLHSSLSNNKQQTEEMSWLPSSVSTSKHPAGSFHPGKQTTD